MQGDYSYLSTEAQLSRLLATYIWILGTHCWAKHVGILGEWEMIFTKYISLPSVLYDYGLFFVKFCVLKQGLVIPCTLNDPGLAS